MSRGTYDRAAEASRYLNQERLNQTIQKPIGSERWKKDPKDREKLTELKFKNHEAVKELGFSPAKRLNVSSPATARLSC